MHKLQLKAKEPGKEGYAMFKTELDTAVAEQKKFLDNLEFQVAVAEAVDPVQAGADLLWFLM